MDTIPRLLLSLPESSTDIRRVYAVGDDRSGAARPLPDLVSGLARRLCALGVAAGVPVAIFAASSPMWLAVDLAVLSLGGVTVGIHPDTPGAQAAALLEHSAAHILIVDDAERYRRLAPHLDDLLDLMYVFSTTPVDGALPLHPAEPDRDFLRAQVAQLRPVASASVICDDGAPARSAGTVLTHRDLLASVQAVQAVLPLHEGDRVLLSAPLSEIVSRNLAYQALLQGAEVVLSSGGADLVTVLSVAQPTVLLADARMLAVLHDAVVAQDAPGRVREGLRAWAVSLGRVTRDATAAGRRIRRRVRLQTALTEALVCAPDRAQLGGRLRVVLSTGTPPDADVYDWFAALGIGLRVGWVVPELGGLVSLTTSDANRVGSAGRVLSHIAWRLASDGELLLRVLEGDGFFQTGEIGAMGPGDEVWVAGPRDGLLATPDGRLVPPDRIEQQLVRSPLIKQAVVVGNQRPYLAALLVLDPDVLAAQAAAGGWPGDESAWRARHVVRSTVQAHIDALNAARPLHEAIQRFAFLPRALTVETGALTPSRRLHRDRIMRQYAALIDALYAR